MSADRRLPRDRRWLARPKAVGVITGVCLLALLALTGTSLRLVNAAAERDARARVLDTATIVGVAATLQIDRLTALVGRAAQQPELVDPLLLGPDPRDGLRIQNNLDQLHQIHQGVATVFVTDPTGRLLAVSPETPSILGTRFNSRDWFQGISRTGVTSYVSNAYRSAVTGHPLVIAAAAPIEGPRRQRLGYLVMGYGLNAIRQLVATVSRTRGIQVTVTDRAGTVLAGASHPNTLVSVLGNPAVSAALDGRSGVQYGRNGSLTAYVPVPGVGWAISVTSNQSDVIQARHRITLSVLALAALLAVGLLSGAGLLAAAQRQRRRIQTSLAEHRQAMQAQETQFRALVHHSNDIIMSVGSDGVVRYLNDSILALLGHQADDLLGQPLIGIAHPDDTETLREIWAAGRPDAVGRIRWRARHADGSWRHLETQWSNQTDEPALGGYVLNSRDVTKQVELELQLADQALHDTLTGLANRALFLDRVAHTLSRRGRSREAQPGVITFNINDFKAVNDSLGHQIGDEVLITVGRRLVACLRPQDTVARLSGDEFAVLVEAVPAPVEALALADRARDALHTPMTVGRTELAIRVGVGVAVATVQTVDAGTLLRDADAAMQVAKTTSAAGAVLYHPDMHRDALARLELTTDLERAVGRSQLWVAYQPTADVATGRIVGAEALLRWEHPEHGPVSPATFIPLAEETGLIRSIGAWVLRQACRQAAEWRAAEVTDTCFSISVNLSGRQLRDPGLVAQVEAALAESGLDASALTLEITESVLVADDQAALAMLRELRDIGVRLALDDFGTGYSSLASLRAFPLHTLKIDKMFVDAIDYRDDDQAFTRTITELGHTLGLVVVAEGVERASQLHRLAEVGCDVAQGFLFGAPMRPGQFSLLLTRSGVA